MLSVTTTSSSSSSITILVICPKPLNVKRIRRLAKVNLLLLFILFLFKKRDKKNEYIGQYCDYDILLPITWMIDSYFMLKCCGKIGIYSLVFLGQLYSVRIAANYSLVGKMIHNCVDILFSLSFSSMTFKCLACFVT